MNTRKSLGRGLLALLALAMTAAACGGDDAASGTEDAATQTTASQAGSSSATSAAADPKADWPDTLRVAAVPSAEEKAQLERYQPIVDVLEEELGIPVEFNFATSYSAVIESMIANKTDVAGFGAFSYVIATGNGAALEPIAISTQEGEEPVYRSYGITQANNTAIDSIEDFAGKTVCFVDPGSTSGYLFPSAGLLEVGINPETGVKGTFAGGHDSSALSVANGTCEAGFAFDTMLTSTLIDQGDLKGIVDTVEDETVNKDQAELKIVWKGPEIPNGPFAMQKSLPASLQSEIKRIFLEDINVKAFVASGRCASADDCKLGDDDAAGYAAVDDATYDGVRKVCEQTKSARCALS
ncbi:MAG: phosphate/phosphite/phosphonate ABC transporter substrate-binding protein [Acidimicrobiia bacterium]